MPLENFTRGVRSSTRHRVVYRQFRHWSVTKFTGNVEVPEVFNNKNCAVFITYDGEPTTLGQFDRYDEETKRFTEHYGLIPIGLNVHIILVSIIDDEIHYAMKSATIAANHVVVIDDGDVHSITQEELVTMIDDLP